MPKTKEQIHAYNKEYSSRPAVIAWAKIRNARPERKAKREAYKRTEAGKIANEKFRKKYISKPEVQRALRNTHLKARYKITLIQYEEMFRQQAGKCKICLKEEKQLHIDHSHQTGKVRGLLCGSCNRALGLLKDNTQFLLKAISYLENR